MDQRKIIDEINYHKAQALTELLYHQEAIIRKEILLIQLSEFHSNHVAFLFLLNINNIWI